MLALKRIGMLAEKASQRGGYAVWGRIFDKDVGEALWGTTEGKKSAEVCPGTLLFPLCLLCSLPHAVPLALVGSRPNLKK
jgi:hypothetical protein